MPLSNHSLIRATALASGLLLAAALFLAITVASGKATAAARSHATVCADVAATHDLWTGTRCLLAPVIIVDRE
ncbi:hypothetical protein GCM10009733_043670 [Nonomuraea maheshkhaliensis]|uniref:Secreted protein n=1 Tax=Nonomuraea maheshkhaliensis TaxID=419590 RepID=A0ABP4RBY0_9ACTN